MKRIVVLGSDGLHRNADARRGSAAFRRAGDCRPGGRVRAWATCSSRRALMACAIWPWAMSAWRRASRSTVRRCAAQAGDPGRRWGFGHGRRGGPGASARGGRRGERAWWAPPVCARATRRCVRARSLRWRTRKVAGGGRRSDHAAGRTGRCAAPRGGHGPRGWPGRCPHAHRLRARRHLPMPAGRIRARGLPLVGYGFGRPLPRSHALPELEDITPCSGARPIPRGAWARRYPSIRPRS